MPTVRWNSPADGLWAVAGNWDDNSVPNDASIAVLLPVFALPYAVTIQPAESDTINKIEIGTSSGGAQVELVVNGTLTLSGGGTSIVHTGALLDGGAPAGAFVSGSGTLINQGVIDADVPGGTLFLFDSHAQLTVTNQSLMKAENGGKLLIETPNFTNFVDHVLTGGTYWTAGAGSVLAFWAASAATATLTTDDTTIILDGAGSALEAGANNTPFHTIESTLTTIDSNGVLRLYDARDFAAGSSVTVQGTLDLRGGTYSGGTLTIASGGTMFGFGKITTAVQGNGTLEARSGYLKLSGGFAGPAAIVDFGSTLALNGTVINPTDNGVLAASGGTLVVDGPVGGAGGFLVDTGATLDLDSANAPVAFNGAGGTLRLEDPAGFASTIFGYGLGDSLYLAGIHADGAKGGSGSLTVTLNGTAVYGLGLDGNYAGSAFSVSYDGSGSKITAVAPTPAARDYAFEGQLWTSHTITWSFATSTYPSDNATGGGANRQIPFSSFITQAAYQTIVQNAFSAWQAVSNLTFVQEPDSPTLAGAADIRIGWGDLGTGNSTDQLGQTNYLYLNGGNALEPDVVIRLEDPADRALVPNGSDYTYAGTSSNLSQVVLHEIGHAIGLAHSTDPTAVMFPSAGPANRNLSASDIAGVEALYATAMPCFLRSTRLATPAGEVAVEALRPGDIVLTSDGQSLPIVWIGDRRVAAADHPDPDGVLPIRICRDAFGVGLPHSDLWVSPDHAVHVDGLLIPARLLLNGASITRDTRVGRPHYYHVELSRHAILLAEGLPAESYLDTGNRSQFGNADGAVLLYPDFARLDRAVASCAPFVTAAEEVLPIWRRLASAAGAFAPRATHGIASDLRVLAGDRRLLAMSVPGGYAFALPRGCRSIRLLSDAARPSDAAPWLEDRRRLGIQVARVSVRTEASLYEIALDSPSLTGGWWRPELSEGRLSRWTDGNAVIALPSGSVSLTLAIVQEAPSALSCPGSLLAVA